MHLPFYVQPRFANGQLFVSRVITSTVANMLYNPSLASVFQEMLLTGYQVVPVPDEWRGRTFDALFHFFVKQRDMLPIALLRKWDWNVLDEVEDDDEDEQE